MIISEIKEKKTQPYEYFHSGTSIAVIRLALVTIEQIAFFYEQVKEILLANSYFEDNMITHFSSSFPAVGPSAFFKGFVPTFIRLGPHTILMFIFLEQLKKHFGYIQTDKQ
ncbi:unnamed protein product [Rotaria sordida]|uniref:Uncharacterized protein n=1 Tax=Rotaria sordida TaxID=392033 RepID=A0A814CD58_9BILA|nr:unnamed protein product [Rotaria sordida]CAF1090017.1 unnamed protein product [Rotaria sordida]CAF4045803.1 unnamed protein product [Rotaria sordida]CAF4094647.1 unnamed protein product [Rotaria sordida]